MTFKPSTTDDVTAEDTKKAKYESWGWRVEVCENGSDFDQLRSALTAAHGETDKPTFDHRRNHHG